MTDEGRTERITVRITPTEKAALEQEAKEWGIGLGTHVHLLLGQRRAGILAKERHICETCDPGACGRAGTVHDGGWCPDWVRGD